MIKLTFCLKRQPHLSREEFQEYWRNVHGPIVQKHAAVLNVRRYVQHHVSTDPINTAIRKGRGGPESFDGIAELWFDSIESMMAPTDTPEGKAAMKALREDEVRFIDAAHSPVSVGEDHPLVGDE